MEKPIKKPAYPIVLYGLLLFASLAATRVLAADKGNVLIGANVPGADQLSEADQDALISRLLQNGVKVIRTGIGDKALPFIIRAHKQGISAIAIVYPNQVGSDEHTRPAHPELGLWAQRPITDADPAKFRAWISPRLAQLETAGVRLTAIELGNEINGPYFNADFDPSQATGRVLGIAQLSDPKDAEGQRISASYKAYLRIMTVLKDVRDQSTVNRTTPIISAGLSDGGLPGKKPGQKLDGVSIPDSLLFLRKNGMDSLVEGYGVHVYPAGLARGSVASLIDNLNKDALAMCTAGKPCWITEWGFSNSSKSCPADDAARTQQFQTTRSAFEHFADQGRLAAAILFAWTDKDDGVFRCGSVTEAGKLALGPI